MTTKRAAKVATATPATADPELRPYDVYKQIAALIGLALLQSLSFGILAPMLPLVITEVLSCVSQLVCLAIEVVRTRTHAPGANTTAQYFARLVTDGEAIDCGVHTHSEVCASL